MSGENNDTLALFQNMASQSDITIMSDKRITSIRNYAFEYMSDLVSVEFPSVTSVGVASFAFCYALQDVFLSAVETIGGSAFRDTILETIELPSITTIAPLVFYNCSSLTRIVLPGDTVSTLSNANAFYNTPIATEEDTGYIYVNPDLVDDYKSATNWSTFADKILAIGSVVVSSSSDARTSVEAYEFQDDADIYYFDFPACETVGDYAFSGCTNLVGFRLAEQSKTCTLGDYVFYGCESVSSDGVIDGHYDVVVLDYVTEIGQYCFAGCTSLGYVDAQLCTSAGQYAFYTCSNIGTFELDGLGYISDALFSECSNMAVLYLGILTYIGDYAFYNAGSEYSGETRVDIDSIANVTTIGQYAFYYANAGLTCGILDMYTSTSSVSLISIDALAFYQATVPDEFAFNRSSGLVFYASSFQNTNAYSEDGYSLTLTGPCSFYSMAFYNSDLQYLYLTNEDEMSTMEAADVFDGSRIDTGYGCVYAPESLYEDYCNDTNWCLVPIEVI